MNQPIIQYHNLGLKDYKEIWDYQETLFDRVLKQRDDNEDQSKVNHLIFVEHPHVYTLGKSGSENNLLIDYIQLQAKDANFYKINRGGDITYHGPGQLVGYPIIDLNAFKIGLKDYIHMLEEAIIISLKKYDIASSRLNGATGVWIDIDKPGKTRKICAIGVRSSHWVTMHGFALNVNTNLSYFSHINPCGFTDKSVTSIEKELGYKIDFDDSKMKVKESFKEIFGFNYME